MRILGFGGCRINSPLMYAEKSDPRVDPSEGEWVPATFALNEVIQTINAWSGDVRIPDDLKTLITAWGSRLVPQPALLSKADCVVIETSAQIELTLDGYAVNRTALSEKLMRPIMAQGKEAHKALSRWFNQGISTFNDDTRIELSKQLLPHIADDIPNVELVRYAVTNMRSQRSAPVEGLKAIKERLDQPLGYVTHTWQFMADGRQIHIPEGFYAELLEATRVLELPVMFPEGTVIEFGVTRAMRPDFRHYSTDFMPTISDKLVAFSGSLV